MVLVVEHGSTRTGRWLRRHRTRLALWIAVAEGALVIFDVIPGWTAFFVALALVLFYVLFGRNLPTESTRQVSWIAAVSQIFVALLPVLVALLTIAAVVVLVVIAAVALAFLFLHRR